MIKRKETTKDPNKKRLSFSFFKKHRALFVSLIIIFAAVASFLVVNYGRYVKEIIQVYYLRTKNFYFNSDKLTPTGKTYEINPWGGTSEYDIHIDMNSMLNSLKGTTSDIVYKVYYECTDTRITCQLDGNDNTRTIGATGHTDNFNVKVIPNQNATFTVGETVQVKIRAVSTSPYVEELKATFNLIIGNYGVGFKVEDEKGRLYLDTLISNTRDQFTAEIILTIENNDLLILDMANSVLDINTTSIPANGYVNKVETDLSGVQHTNQYIKKIKFYVPPKSSMMVRFYKSNPNAYYSTMDNVVSYECLNCD